METTLRHLVTTLKYVTDRQALLILSAQHFTLPALITTKYLKNQLTILFSSYRNFNLRGVTLID